MSDPITTPSAQNPFFLFDPEEVFEMTFYPTEEERDAAAQEALQDCLDGEEWLEGVDRIMTGTITHTVQKVTPEAEKPDQSRQGEFEGELCDFILQPLNSASNP